MTADLLQDTRGARHPSPTLPSRIRHHRATPAVLVGVFGFLVSVVGITGPSVWYDEAATITSATRSWPELWQMVGNVDAVHAAYYVLMHLVFDVFGYSPLTLRLPSAIAVGVAAGLTVMLVRMLGGHGHAVLAGIVFCLLPRVTWMGTEGRSYALSAALGVAMTIVLVKAIRSNRKRWWAVYIAVAVFSCAIFIYIALFVVAHGLTIAWWSVSARARAAQAVLRWAVAAAVIVLCLLPLGLAIMDQNSQISWIEDLGRDTWRQVYRTQWFMFDYTFATVAWILIALGTIVMARRPHGLSLASVVIPVLVVPTTALIVATAVYSPLYSPRYLTMCTPFVAIAMSALIAAVRPRFMAAVPMALVIALAIPNWVQERMPQAKQDSTWSEVADLIAAERAEDGTDSTTAIIYGWTRRHATATSRVIEYSYPEPFRGTVDVTLTVPAGETGGLWEEAAPLDESLDRLEGTDVAYLITSIKRDLRPETTATMESIGWDLTEEWNLVDVNVLKYELDR